MNEKVTTLTIAIPAYNEAGSIQKVVTRALQSAKKLASHFEILVVDDGSTDETGKILSALARKNAHIRLIRHAKNLGFSGAIKSCYKNATKELVFLLPGDGQIDSDDCALFLKKIQHADVVVGFRTNNPEPWTRRLNSWIFHTVYRTLFGVRLREISTSILWRKKVLDSLNITAIPRSALIEPEVIYKAWAANWRVAEVGIPYYSRKAGQAKGSNPLMILVTIRELLRLWWEQRVNPHVR